MKKLAFGSLKKYIVQAKRRGKKEEWTEWTNVDDYEEAVKHAKRAEQAGYDTRIVKRSEYEG